LVCIFLHCFQLTVCFYAFYERFPSYFQISVPVQPGNSGGALVDDRATSSASCRPRCWRTATMCGGGAGCGGVGVLIQNFAGLEIIQPLPI
jgi:hypothetical protein